MSFPGYLKSLNLVNKNNDISENPGDLRNVDGTQGTRVHGSELITRDKGSNSRAALTSTSNVGLVLDEKGNHATRSLWVGNIPPRTTSTDVRALFSKFGPIVSTRPAAKYAFVNFERVESAIAAFKQYHDQDVFQTGNGTINIRFTGSLAEAKHAKDDLRDAQAPAPAPSKGEAAQKQWFQPIDSSSCTNLPKSPDRIEWPNGKPPTGPKSHRKDISPPPLRRGDSYRPAELSRRSSFQSTSDYKRADRDDYQRGRAYSRISNEHYSPVYSSSHSLSPVRTTSSRASPEICSRVDESPLPWERTRNKERSRGLNQTKQPHDEIAGCDEMSDRPETASLQNVNQTKERREESRAITFERDAESPPHIHLRTPDGQRDYEVHSDLLLEEAYSLSVEVQAEEVTSLAPIPSDKQQSKSPSLRPLERLRVENESLRGSSVASEVATTSSRASARKRKCYDCRKLASDVSPLTSCSQCMRRFHSGCGDPKPSSCADKSLYVCGRCQRKQETAAQLDSFNIETKAITKLNGKVYLVSPPLSLNQDGNGSATLSPCDDVSRILSDEHKLESFFPNTSERFAADMCPVDDRISQPLPYHFTTSVPKSDHPATIHHPQSPPISTTTQHINDEKGLELQNKYKVVTCKWWALGNCTQSEEGCYYAHKNTGILFPDRKRVNKSWTCYEWLHDKCMISDRDCLHAHKDTGLQIWRDGRPSFKHVTCFWWCKGRCKWNDEACKFAHEDTGLYSLDPSEIWHGGYKFSTTHPADSTTRPTQNRGGTGFSISSNNDVDRGEELRCVSALPTGTVLSTHHSTVSPSKAKPPLSINTFAHTTTSKNYASEDFDRCPVTADALPETLNDNHSSRNRNDLSIISPATLKLLSRISNLSTSANDEPLQHEDGMYNVGDVFESTPVVLHTAPYSNLNTGGEIGNSWFTSENNYHNNHLRDDLENHVIVDEVDSSSKTSSRATKDPRLQRQSQVNHNAIASSDFHSPKDTDVEATGAIMKNPEEAIHNSPPGLENTPRRSVKKCQKCQKPVFGTDLCRTCTGRKDDSTTDHIPDQRNRPVDTESPARHGTRLIPKVMSSPMQNSVEMVETSGQQNTSKNQLKRSVSGNNMFLVNKRQKTSMACSFSGSIRPGVAHSRPSERRPSFISTNADSRRERQTLEDLIHQERQKKLNDTVTGGDIVQSPASENEKENKEPKDLNEQQQHTSREGSADPDVDRPMSRPSIAETLASTSNDLFSSPQLSPVTEQSVSPTTESNLKGDSRRNKQTSERDQSPSASQIEKHLSNSEYPKLQATITPSDISDTVTAAQKSPYRRSFVYQKGKPPILNRVSSRDVVVSPDKFAWASPITCIQCQKHHKKCLHDDDGSLSASKCREYVLSRKGKPDTGRSRHEWNAILLASELEPDSDDDLDPGEDDIEMDFAQEQTSNDSDEEYATAIGGDEAMDYGDATDEDDEARELLEKFIKKPSELVQPPPRRKSPSSITKFFRQHDDGWTTAKEEAKRHELGRKGVMFESESEEEDYLSDQCEAPTKRDRVIDPLYIPPRVSRDLFEIAPELEYDGQRMMMEMQRQREPRPSRKEQWAQLRSKQLQDRREKFGNPHWEVNRVRDAVYVTALVERIVPPQNTEDRFAVGSVQTKEERITFSDFIGAPRIPEICLMNDGERLGFQDGQKERDRIFGRTGRELCRLATDDEKWPVRMK